MTTPEVQEDSQPRWNLTSIFPSLDSPEFNAAFEELEEQIADLQSYGEETGLTSGDVSNEPGAVASGWITRLNDMQRNILTLRPFVYLLTSADTYDTAAQKKLSELVQTLIPVHQLDTQFKSWLGAHADQIKSIIGHDETTQEHAFYLTDTADESQYLMSPKEEELATEMFPAGPIAWGKLQGNIVSQLKVDFAEDGETKTIPVTALINYRDHADEDVRRRAYEAEMQAWESVEVPLAAALNGVKGGVSVVDRRRGREDNLHSALSAARMDRASLEAMLSAMQDSFPKFRSYFKAKARKIGKEQLAWWDLFAPVGDNERIYTYEEAQDFVIEQFNAFSPELAGYAQMAFDNEWLDVGPRDGKRAGAFCMPVTGRNESRILLNFNGSLDSIFTLAHELGHGFHNYCQAGKTPLQRANPMTLAETASIMCETIVTNAALEQASSPKEELAILEPRLVGDSQVIVDIYSRYLFETEVFKRRSQSELSAEELNSIMEDAQAECYGDALDADFRHKYMWTWKPHYYQSGLSFYNFPYAFGLLFGTGLYAIYQERGSDFVDDYKELLASTGSANAATLGDRFGINIREKAFWENSLNVVGERVDRYVEL